MAAWNLPAEVAFVDRTVGQRTASPHGVALVAASGRRSVCPGRQTVASWLRGGELGNDFRLYYYFLSSLGRNAKSVATALFRIAVRKIVPGDRLLLALGGAERRCSAVPGSCAALAPREQASRPPQFRIAWRSRILQGLKPGMG